jgi:rubredoxin
MDLSVCLVSGHIYDPARGDAQAEIPPGVSFSNLPADRACPECGAGKDQFRQVD